MHVLLAPVTPISKSISSFAFSPAYTHTSKPNNLSNGATKSY